jgi:hypothetical protein
MSQLKKINMWYRERDVVVVRIHQGTTLHTVILAASRDRIAYSAFEKTCIIRELRLQMDWR